MHIRCPKCNWEPDGGAHWYCQCGHQWDTFSTAARCPGCGYQHEVTQCPDEPGGCSAFSPHLDWYEGLDEPVEEIVKEELSVRW